MTRRRPHLFVFHNCGGFNYAFLSKVALITAVQLRCRWNVNGTLSTRAVLIGWQRAKCRSASFPDDSNNKPKRKSLKGTNEQMVVGIMVWLWWEINRPPLLLRVAVCVARHIKRALVLQPQSKQAGFLMFNLTLRSLCLLPVFTR